MKRLAAAIALGAFAALAPSADVPPPGPPPGYDVVYVRSPRPVDAGGQPTRPVFDEVYRPLARPKGSDLVLSHRPDPAAGRPDRWDEVLVPGGIGACGDPAVSFDAEWVYYTYYYDQTEVEAGAWFSSQGADVWKVRVRPNADGTHDRVNLTGGIGYAVNAGAQPWAADLLTKAPPAGKVSLGFAPFHVHPCPLPGGRLCFVSNAHGYVPNARGQQFPTLQLAVMDEDGGNLDVIGVMNLGCALHPVVTQDGEILWSSFESGHVRDKRSWSIFRIKPDGTGFSPVVFASMGSITFHFHGEMSDRTLFTLGYYNGSNYGSGALYARSSYTSSFPNGETGSGDLGDPRNVKFTTARTNLSQVRFTSAGWRALTPFADFRDNPSAKDADGVTYLGKVATPSGAPDNRVLLAWSGGPMCSNVPPGTPPTPYPNYGIYLTPPGGLCTTIADATPVVAPDPRYNAMSPKALVTYDRFCGLPQPKLLPPNRNDGGVNPALLPRGTPAALLGSSSTYNSAWYPNGKHVNGDVTATWNGLPAGDPARGLRANDGTNWIQQGAVAGYFTPDQVVAIRVVEQVFNSDGRQGAPFRFSPLLSKRFLTHGGERQRTRAEVPVLEYVNGQVTREDPNDPESRPDTSWQVRVVGGQPFTLAAIDEDGCNLAVAGTWHQTMPGADEHRCNGCHAHDEAGHRWENSKAGRPGTTYQPLDALFKSPVLVGKDKDQSKRQWNDKDTVGLAYASEPPMPEWFRDIRPMIQAKCVSCHTGDTPPGNLALDRTADESIGSVGIKVPGDLFTVAWDEGGKYGKQGADPAFKGDAFRRASRLVMKFASRQSLLYWYVKGKRTDGLPNGARGDLVDYPDYATWPADRAKCPAPTLVTEDERRTLVRWIDVSGCGADLDPAGRYGFFADDNRPTLWVEFTPTGAVIGAWDVGRGLDPATLSVTCSVPLCETPAGAELASRFAALDPQPPNTRWGWTFPVTLPAGATLSVSVKDLAGNQAAVRRTLK